MDPDTRYLTSIFCKFFLFWVSDSRWKQHFAYKFRFATKMDFEIAFLGYAYTPKDANFHQLYVLIFDLLNKSFMTKEIPFPIQAPNHITLLSKYYKSLSQYSIHLISLKIFFSLEFIVKTVRCAFGSFLFAKYLTKNNYFIQL